MALQEAFIAVARQTIQMTQISRRNVVVAKRERAAIGDADSLVLVQGRANRIKNLQLAGHVGVQKSIPARALGMHEGTIHWRAHIGGYNGRGAAECNFGEVPKNVKQLITIVLKICVCCVPVTSKFPVVPGSFLLVTETPLGNSSRIRAWAARKRGP